MGRFVEVCAAFWSFQAVYFFHLVCFQPFLPVLFFRHDSFGDSASTVTEILNEMNMMGTDFSLSTSSTMDDTSEV